MISERYFAGFGFAPADAADAATTSRLSPAAAAFAGWIPCAAVQAVYVLSRVRSATPTELAVTVAHEVGSAAFAGLVAALAVGLWSAVRQAGLPKIKPWVALTIGTLLLLSVAVVLSLSTRVDMDQFVGRHAHKVHLSRNWARRAAVGSMAVAITGALPFARFLARPKLRWIPVAFATLAMAADYRLLQSDYWAAHFVVAFSSSVLAGGALVGAEVPRWLVPSPKVRIGLAAALGALALWAVAIPPAPGLAFRILLTRATPTAVLLRAWGYHGPRGNPVIPPEQAAWFVPRGDLPPIPSSTPAEVASRAIVVMVSVDCFRGDVFEDPANADLFPELAKVRAESVYFSHAYNPGSQTVYTLSSWFSGKYFSQLFWSKGDTTQFWPKADRTKRFPALLTANGVETDYVMAANWLGSRHGLATGFAHYDDLRKGKRFSNYAPAHQAAGHLISHLENAGGPTFLYSHWMDAHRPYKGVPKASDDLVNYRAELHKVDGELGRLRRRIHELGLDDRTTLIVTADHGETFGEHGMHHHGVSVYDELIHVPLLVRGPGYPARTVETPISTLDLGPTILDGFGVETPATTMGESLVPVLRGGEPKMTRPILAENRLTQTMIFPSGKKVIRDLRLGAGAAYDLKSDPKELDNRIDDPTFDTKNEFALLNEFFRVHDYKRKGYHVPWRR